MAVACFLISLFLHDDTPQMRATGGAHMEPQRALVQPASVGLFAGKREYRRLGALDRLAARVIKAPEGDFRNWDAIRAWAAQAPPLAQARLANPHCVE